VQIVNLLAAVTTLIIARKLYNYNFKALVTSMRFSQVVFSKTKNLAFTSLYLTITWILYYELDPASIGKFIGARQVAVYAIGLTVLSFFRSILGILFSPFSSRFNHFIGANDEAGLKNIYLQVTTMMAPLVVIPIVTVSLLAKPLILSWVGGNYVDSVEITQLLVLCNLFAFITYPASMLLMAQERVKEMYIVNTLIPVIFWSGIILTYSFFGLKSFAIFKFIAFGISAVVYYFIMLKFLKINVMQSFKEIFRPILFPIIFLIVAAFIVKDFLPFEKSKLNLFMVAVTAGSLILVSFIIQYFSSVQIRTYINKTLTDYKI
jgi:O-antigen/teichoic acid export membrane protein